MVDPTSYRSDSGLREGYKRVGQLEEVFDEIKSKYSDELTTYIEEGDLKSLNKCVGMLLPLSMQDSAQRELRETENIEDCLWYKSGDLCQRIMIYLTNFSNSGVRKVPIDKTK